MSFQNVKFDVDDFEVLGKSVTIFNIVDALVNYGEHSETCSELQIKLRKLEHDTIRNEETTEE